MSLDWNQIELRLNPYRFNYSMGARSYRQDKSWFSNALTDYDLWYCTGGKADLHVGEEEVYRLERGALVLFRPRMECELIQKPRNALLRMYYFHFDLWDREAQASLPPDAIADLPICYKPQDTLYVEATCQKVLSRLQFWRRLPNTAPPGLSALAREQAHLLFRSLLAEVELESGQPESMPLSRGMSAHYRMVMDLVAEMYSAPQRFTSVEAVARSHSYSMDHFTRIFKAATGKTVSQTLIDARIHRARQLLHDMSLGTAEIASLLGYESTGFFYRQFRQQTGETPTAFRKRSL